MLSSHEVLQRRYRIVRLIGEGSMGAVYEAVDESFGERVAVKEVQYELTGSINKNQLESLKNGFKREAMSLSKARHPAVPYVRDYFLHRDRQYVVIDMVDGDDLGHMLLERGKPFPLKDVLDWGDQLLDALDYLHNLDPPIIHGDIKPQNLKLTAGGKLMLLDLEIAKTVDIVAFAVQSSEREFTALNYLPFEKVLSVIDPSFREFVLLKHKDKAAKVLEQNCDARSDIYMAGATLYYLLTDRPATDVVKRALDIWDGKPDPMSGPACFEQEIPISVADCIRKALEIERDDRFESAAAMRSALHESAGRNSEPEQNVSFTPIVVENGHSNGKQHRPVEPTEVPQVEQAVTAPKFVPISTKLGPELIRPTAPLTTLPDLRTNTRIPTLEIKELDETDEIENLPKSEPELATAAEIATGNEPTGNGATIELPESIADDKINASDEKELLAQPRSKTEERPKADVHFDREHLSKPESIKSIVVTVEPPSTPLPRIAIPVTASVAPIKKTPSTRAMNGHIETTGPSRRVRPASMSIWDSVLRSVSDAGKFARAYRSRIRIPFWITLSAAAAVLTVFGIVVLVWLLSLGKPATDISAGTTVPTRSALPQTVESSVSETPRYERPEPQSQTQQPAATQDQRLITDNVAPPPTSREAKLKKSAPKTETQKPAVEQAKSAKPDAAIVQPTQKPKEEKKKVTVDDLINDN